MLYEAPRLIGALTLNAPPAVSSEYLSLLYSSRRLRFSIGECQTTPPNNPMLGPWKNWPKFTLPPLPPVNAARFLNDETSEPSGLGKVSTPANRPQPNPAVTSKSWILLEATKYS